jgi:hypothetical protein
MKRLVNKNDKAGLHSYVRSLIQKFEKPWKTTKHQKAPLVAS